MQRFKIRLRSLPSRKAKKFAVVLLTMAILTPLSLVVFTSSAGAIGTAVPLGSTASFAVLGASTVTNTGPSVLNGNLGLYAGTSVTGFPPGIITPPSTEYVADSTAQTAQSDLTIASGNAAGQTPTTTYSSGDNQLGGLTLDAGVYAFGAAATANLAGTAANPLTLNGQGNPNAVFIFQASSTLVTSSSSVVALENGAQACNVFWVVGSSATLNSGSIFVGTVLAADSISVNSGVTIEGRLLASTAAVTLIDDTITAPTCAVTPTPPTTTTVSTPSTTTTPAPGASTVAKSPKTKAAAAKAAKARAAAKKAALAKAAAPKGASTTKLPTAPTSPIAPTPVAVTG